MLLCMVTPEVTFPGTASLERVIASASRTKLSRQHLAHDVPHWYTQDCQLLGVMHVAWLNTCSLDC